MTAHELAKALLEMPDNEISFQQYKNAGELLAVNLVFMPPDGHYPYVILAEYD